MQKLDHIYPSSIPVPLPKFSHVIILFPKYMTIKGIKYQILIPKGENGIQSVLRLFVGCSNMVSL